MHLLILYVHIALGLTVSTVMNFVAGPATQVNSMFAASPNTLIANGTSSSTLTFMARDAYNNVIANVPVTLAASGGNTVFGATSGTTDASGSLWHSAQGLAHSVHPFTIGWAQVRRPTDGR